MDFEKMEDRALDAMVQSAVFGQPTRLLWCECLPDGCNTSVQRNQKNPRNDGSAWWVGQEPCYKPDAEEHKLEYVAQYPESEFSMLWEVVPAYTTDLNHAYEALRESGLRYEIDNNPEGANILLFRWLGADLGWKDVAYETGDPDHLARTIVIALLKATKEEEKDG